MLNLGDAAAANLLDLRYEGVRLVELFNVIASSYALAHEQDVRHRSSACRLVQEGL